MKIIGALLNQGNQGSGLSFGGPAVPISPVVDVSSNTDFSQNAISSGTGVDDLSSNSISTSNAVSTDVQGPAVNSGDQSIDIRGQPNTQSQQQFVSSNQQSGGRGFGNSQGQVYSGYVQSSPNNQPQQQYVSTSQQVRGFGNSQGQSYNGNVDNTVEIQPQRLVAVNQQSGVRGFGDSQGQAYSVNSDISPVQYLIQQAPTKYVFVPIPQPVNYIPQPINYAPQPYFYPQNIPPPPPRVDFGGDYYGNQVPDSQTSFNSGSQSGNDGNQVPDNNPSFNSGSQSTDVVVASQGSSQVAQPCPPQTQDNLSVAPVNTRVDTSASFVDSTSTNQLPETFPTTLIDTQPTVAISQTSSNTVQEPTNTYLPANPETSNQIRY